MDQATIASVKPPQPPEILGHYICILAQTQNEGAEHLPRGHVGETISYYYRGDMAAAYAVMGFAHDNGLDAELAPLSWPRHWPYSRNFIDRLGAQGIFPAAIMVQMLLPQDPAHMHAQEGVVCFYQLPPDSKALFRPVRGVERYAAACVTFHDSMGGDPVEDAYRHHGYRYDDKGGIVGEFSVQDGFNVWAMHARLVGNLSR